MKYVFDPLFDHLYFNILVEAELPLQSWGNADVAGFSNATIIILETTEMCKVDGGEAVEAPGFLQMEA